MRFVRLEVLRVSFPFRISFGHAHTSRSSSTNVLVRVETDRGVVGYGESVPRDYVTGETPEGAVELIANTLGPALLGRQAASAADSPRLIGEVFGQLDPAQPAGAACCAVELAVLDALSRAEGRSVSGLLGPLVRQEVAYSGVLPLLPAPLMLLGGLLHRLYGVDTVKLKVGRSVQEDLRNLKLLRATLGPRADLRVDANCAWQPDEAIAVIRAMRPYNVSAVEQPVAKEDFAGLKWVADAVETPIMADESLCTLDDARQLAAGRMVDQFNIRISKCGGLLAARQIADIAAEAGLTCQMGAHPGESAVLAAAGRHFATTTPNLRYLEGSAGGILLKQDIVDLGIGPGWGGRAPALRGPGLGVQVNEAKLAPFVIERRQLEV
jgi:L-Ala-D/L-Glu epimerase / N-acetyl-D-glutamate racemase